MPGRLIHFPTVPLRALTRRQLATISSKTNNRQQYIGHSVVYTDMQLAINTCNRTRVTQNHAKHEITEVNVKGKVRPRKGHEAPEGE